MTLVQSFSGICQGPIRLGGNYFVTQVIFGTSQALKILISYTHTKLDSVTFQGYFWILFFYKAPVFVCLFVFVVVVLFYAPRLFLQEVISSFWYLPGVKVNFCHAHKVRFFYPLEMLYILYFYYYCLFFLTSTPVIFNFFCKAVLLFLKRSISSSFGTFYRA